MTPFIPDTRLTAIALGIRNAEFIADMVAPRVDVASETFRYTEFNHVEMFNVPNTLVGRKGTPNEVEFTATEKTGSTEDHGLTDKVPQTDIDAAKGHPSIDPVGMAAAKTAELVLLAREKRVADFVQNSANYNHTEALGAGSKFTDYTSDQVEIIGSALEVPLVRPNTMVLGHTEWFHLRRNEKLIKAILRTTNGTGIITKAEFMEFFELNELLVGASRSNTANKGQTANLTRLWNGTAALHYKKPAAQLKNDITFMLTASWGGRIAMQKQLGAGELGLRGGVQVIVGDSLKEQPISKEAGYLFTSVI